MKVLRAINNMIAKVEFGFVILILTSMVLLAFTQIILRNFFSTSISWADILLRHLVLWIGFIGASLATKEQRHINIDVLSRIIPEKASEYIHVVTNLFAAIICFFLTRAAVRFVIMEQEMGSTIFAGIPIWIAESIIAAGFGLMTFRFALQAIENIAHLMAKEGEES